MEQAVYCKGIRSSKEGRKGRKYVRRPSSPERRVDFELRWNYEEIAERLQRPDDRSIQRNYSSSQNRRKGALVGVGVGVGVGFVSVEPTGYNHLHR